MALSCIISEIKRNIGRKLRFFHTPCIRRPHCWVTVEIVSQGLLWKNQWCGYLIVKKVEDMITRVDTIHLCTASRGKKITCKQRVRLEMSHRHIILSSQNTIKTVCSLLGREQNSQHSRFTNRRLMRLIVTRSV